MTNKLKMMMLAAILVMGTMLSGCSGCVTVPPGHKGIKIYLLGSEKGDFEVVDVGRQWVGFNERIELFPTYKQNYNWTKSATEGSKNDESIAFQTREGLTVGADVGITYHVNPGKVDVLFQTYRRGVEEITDTFLRNQVRDAFVTLASEMPVASVYGKGKQELVDAVTKKVHDAVVKTGIEVERIYLVGNMRLPKSVTGALQAKVAATQRAQQRENELREAEAVAKKDVAKATGEALAKAATADGDAKSILAIATAQAEANRILSKSITPTLVNYKRIEKWNGVMPTVTTGTGGGVLLNLSK